MPRIRPRYRVLAVLVTCLAFAGTAAAQEVQLPLVVSDGATSIDLRIGIDPIATDGLDVVLGEEERPPVPPAGTFDARLIDSDLSRAGLGEGTLIDIVQGDSTCNCIRTYELSFQSGTGNPIEIAWMFSDGVVARLRDLGGGAVLDETLVGSGSTVIADSLVDRALLDVDYVRLINDPPEFTSQPLSDGVQDQPYAYALTAFDADDDSLAFSLVGPTWLQIEDRRRSSATLAGVPKNEHVGTQSVSLNVSDGQLTSTQSFELNIQNVNDPPSFDEAGPVQLLAIEDSLLSFTAVASDPDQDELVFEIDPPLPSWATGTDNGDNSFTLSGIPREADIGPGRTFVLTAEDSDFSTSLNLEIEYLSVNDAPTRPVLTIPVDSSVLILQGDPLARVRVEWLASTDTDGPEDVSYRWSVSVSEDFESGQLFGLETDTVFIDIEQRRIVSVVDSLGVPLGGSILLWHRVEAWDGELSAEGAARQVTLIRGEITAASAASPRQFALYHCFPNPANEFTTIRYDLPRPATVRIEIFDIIGRQVRALTAEQPAGTHNTKVVVADLPAGSYFYRVDTGSTAAVRPLTVMR